VQDGRARTQVIYPVSVGHKPQVYIGAFFGLKIPFVVLPADMEEENDTERKCKRSPSLSTEDEDEDESEQPAPKRQESQGEVPQILPTTFPPVAIPEGWELRKRNAKDVETPPRSDKFVHEKEWVAIWVSSDPAKSHTRQTLWEKDPHRELLLPYLAHVGWTERELICKPASGSETCIYSGPDGIVCGTKLDWAHTPRHMLKHLPKGIGYFFVCPVCKQVARRCDMAGERHKKGRCEWNGASKELNALMRKNAFLR
jgi:hypothetical protein